jgi:glutathione S-transferase
VPYEAVTVPDFRPMRKEVYDVSGQYYVPVIKDGETVLTDTRSILAYLDERYGRDGEGTEAVDDMQDPPSCSL